MLIKWVFSNGDVTVVDVDDDAGRMILDSRRKEHASNERERYHREYSLDGYEDKKNSPTSPYNPVAEFERKELRSELECALARLTETQRRRLLMFAEGARIAEIARAEGVSFNSVKKSIQEAITLMKKYLLDG